MVGKNCYLASALGTPGTCLVKSLRTPGLPDPVASSLWQVTLWVSFSASFILWFRFVTCMWSEGSVPNLSELLGPWRWVRCSFYPSRTDTQQRRQMHGPEGAMGVLPVVCQKPVWQALLGFMVRIRRRAWKEHIKSTGGRHVKFKIPFHP